MVRRPYDPRFRRYRIAVYSVFLVVMGWVMVTLMVSIVQHVIRVQ
jgi:hypothetical protein